MQLAKFEALATCSDVPVVRACMHGFMYACIDLACSA